MLDTREAVTTLCGTDGGLDMNDGIRINGIRHGRQYVLKPDLSAGGVAFYEGSNGAKPEDREAALWIDAVVNDKPPFVLPEQAYAVSQILEGIYISARTRRAILFQQVIGNRCTFYRFAAPFFKINWQKGRTNNEGWRANRPAFGTAIAGGALLSTLARC